MAQANKKSSLKCDLRENKKFIPSTKGWGEGQREVRGGRERTESQDSESVGVRIQVRAQVRAGSTRGPRDPPLDKVYWSALPLPSRTSPPQVYSPLADMGVNSVCKLTAKY